MTADSWGVCPQCLAKAESEKLSQQLAMDAAYGKVPLRDFDKIRKIAETEVEMDETLREDYEFWVDYEDAVNPVFHIKYHARCQSARDRSEGGEPDCDFEFEYKHSVPYVSQNK